MPITAKPCMCRYVRSRQTANAACFKSKESVDLVPDEALSALNATMFCQPCGRS